MAHHNQQQSQKSLTDQLRDLQAIANSHGLYDAADFLESILESYRERESRKPELREGD